jgi:uncharacterized membrane protein
VLLYLLVVDYKVNRVRQDSLGGEHYLCHLKSWIFINGLVYYLMFFLRYTFPPSLIPKAVYNGSLMFGEAVKFSVMLIVFCYFLKQAISLFTEREFQRWKRILTILSVFYTLIALTYALWYVIYYDHNNHPSMHFCHSP